MHYQITGELASFSHLLSSTSYCLRTVVADGLSRSNFKIKTRARYYV